MNITAYPHSIESFPQIYMIVPPDKGFSWCVMVMSFVTSCILDGAIFVGSDIFEDLQKDWNLTKQQTSFISAVHLGAYFCLGPFASAFINQYGFRVVALTGCVIAMTGVFVGSFMNGLTALVLTYGTLLGAGGGMAYTSSNLINNYYFEKYRPIAAGVVGSGFGIAILIFSPVNKILVTKFGWRNTLRVHGALIGIVFILSLFFRPVKPSRIGEVRIREPNKIAESSSSEGQVTKVFVQPDMISTISVAKPPAQRKFVLTKKSRFSRCCRYLKMKCCCCCKCGLLGKRISSMIESKFVIEMGPLDRKDIFYPGQLEYQPSVQEASKIEVEKMFYTKNDSVVC